MDAKIRTIDVTAEDIRIGQKAIKRGDRPTAQCCAIARAIKRHFRAKRVIWYYEGGSTERFKLFAIDKQTGARTDRFVLAHDRGEPVKPFTFQVSIGTTEAV